MTMGVEEPSSQEHLRFLIEAGRVLGGSLDLRATLTALVELVVPRFALWCMVEVSGSARAQAAHSTPVQRQQASPLLAQAMSTGQLQEEPGVLVLPLIVQKKRLGAVAFGTDPVNPVSPEYYELAWELASRTALAVEHAELYREARRQAERLQLLAEASRLLTEAGSDFDTAFRRIVRHVCESIGDACVLTVARTTGGPQEPVAIDHRDAVRGRQLAQASAGGIGLAGPVYASGRALRIEHVPEEHLDQIVQGRPLLSRYLRESGVSSLLVVPLRVGTRVIGTLGVARDAGGTLYTADDESLLQDLADRAGLVFEKARLYQEAQNALATREAFLSVASHELRTPLSTMRLQVQRFIRQIRPTDAVPGTQVIERLRSVDDQVSRLGRLVDDLLDVSRITAGRLELEPQEMDLSALVHDVIERFEGALSVAGCLLDLDIGPAVIGRWDRSRVDQIVTNLLANATKYGRGKPIHLCVGQTDRMASVSVRDEGIGIAPEDQQRIFERFERAVSSRNYGGFGLGLWISRQLAIAHGGEIRVTSALGQGATFVLELPLAQLPR